MSTPRGRRLITLVLTGVVGLALVLGVVIGGGLLSGQEPKAAPKRPAPTSSEAPQPPPAKPVNVPEGQPPGTIRLPKGGTAKLVRKEIDSSGTLPVPDGVEEATWWGAGLDSPKGATVLAGHVNWDGAIGPFEELWESKTGELVTVLDEQGKTWRYRVSEVVTVHKNDLPQRAAELFGQEGPHRLVLVTCGGRFVGGDTGYDENRIVVAAPVP